MDLNNELRKLDEEFFGGEIDNLEPCLNELGIEIRHRYDKIYLDCPVCEGEGKIQLWYNADKLCFKWRCWKSNCQRKKYDSLAGLIYAYGAKSPLAAVNSLKDILRKPEGKLHRNEVIYYKKHHGKMFHQIPNHYLYWLMAEAEFTPIELKDKLTEYFYGELSYAEPMGIPF